MMGIRFRFKIFEFIFPVFSIIFFCCSWDTAHARDDFTVLLTSNTQGKFNLETENQDSEDPLLILAQNILAERQNGVDIYLDLGNAFYPGVLSKYSSGSIMMDFLDYFSCNATLVSAKDLQIGLKNLEFLQNNKKARLLSSNISRGEDTVFTPYFFADIKDTRIAIVGVSSKKIKFDIAEKRLYDIHLEDESVALEPVFKEIRATGVEHILLLSGLELNQTIQLLETFPEIDMAICGGDYIGKLYSTKVSRIDLADGRSIVMTDESTDYYILKLAVNKGISIRSVEPRMAFPIETHQRRYQQFAYRCALWKEKFQKDSDQLIASLDGKEYMPDDLMLAQLLSDRFNSEIAVVDRYTIQKYPAKKDIRHSDLISLVNFDYNIFTFFLTGEQLKALHMQADGLVIANLDENLTIQGYPLDGKRQYKVAATQSAFENIEQIIGSEIAYSNTWKTVSELLFEDLKNEQVALRENSIHLDRRFRTIVDVSLSNFIINSHVERGENIQTPVSQPAKSYSKWGLENEIDLIFYNKYHRFWLTPYMIYMRQDDDYLHNLLRGTFLYEYNLSDALKPYNKFQFDTVVVETDRQRPMELRETVGISTYSKYFDGKLGIGFEKKIQDPAEDALYGIEALIGVRYTFLDHFTYELDTDTFLGKRDGGNRWKLRSEIENSISAKINSYLSVSLRYKYFFLREETGEDYRNSQIITSVDLNTGWKFW